MSIGDKSLNELGDFLLSKCSDNVKIDKEQIFSALKEFKEFNKAKEVDNLSQNKIKVKNVEVSSGMKKVANSGLNRQKIEKIQKVLEQKNQRQLELINEYRSFKDQLERNKLRGADNDDDEDDQDEDRQHQGNGSQEAARIPCLKQDCKKSYGTFKARKLHIINKHKMLAVKLDYIKYICEVCEDYTSNDFDAYKDHEEGCAMEQSKVLGLQGIHFDNELKLTKEQNQMLQQAKKFN
ncbi:hypothetical protein TTHERM_00539011 (macronuclear) [Tetrahymena thermophila SB210]|uniref:Uncharacterized protein n=1 Tax=Tetrahymena thermophila (strain SB210) TaxID=312017 RepID=A4VET1_TETTS|nr:hypothetical protein TTHERM_00539011 [Tetrahymena thermophila SB210]EDK32037.1 hypothetical protein TTHERM_00539011 [Tetrahymena thermophila SB210]|eukprot:XP_001470726.1 hypothetical protein TTHERM_00539011 [Tetrahymena thermophila SB210]